MTDEAEIPKPKQKRPHAGVRKRAPGPRVPPGTPTDEHGAIAEGAEVAADWARRNGYDREAAETRQRARNIASARDRGEHVTLDLPDDAKFALLRERHPDARVRFEQVYPMKNQGIPGSIVRAFRDYHALLDHVTQRVWQGGEATYTWRVSDARGPLGGGEIVLFGDKDVAPPEPQPTAQPAQPTTTAQPQPPAGQVWNGYQWVPAPAPQPPVGQMWNGYQWVPAVAPQPVPSPPPPPTPPTPAPGDTPATMELKFQLMLREHELKMREWELMHRAPPPAPQPVYQPPPPPQETPLQVSLRDPEFFRYYYTQGAGAAQLGLKPAAAPAAATPEPPKPIDPIAETEKAFAHHGRVLKLVKGLTEQVAPPPPPPPPAPPPDPHSLVKLHNLGPLSMLEIDGKVQDNAAGLALANYGKIKEELDGLIDKVGKRVESVMDKKREATESEAAARREESKLADEARDKNERHARVMREEAEALTRAESVRLQLRQMAEAKPEKGEDLGELRVPAPPPEAGEDPAVDPPTN